VSNEIAPSPTPQDANPKGLVERLVGRDRPHSERPSAYWAWHDRLAADPTCWKFSDREDAIAFAAFIAGWYLRTDEDPDALLSPNVRDHSPRSAGAADAREADKASAVTARRGLVDRLVRILFYENSRTN